MKRSKQFGIKLVISTFLMLFLGSSVYSADIPLPEHPRPDFMRADWLNLNGKWQFEFDKANVGESESWFAGNKAFTKDILVPFPWGSELSGIKDEADIGWYSRKITVPADWKGKKVFVVVGASDWISKGWFDGKELGSHQGGYTPFEFELTDIKWGSEQTLTLRVDDTPHPFKLEGKQGYGRAAGIWQTVYLEARPELAIETIHYYPDIDNGKVTVKAELNKATARDSEMILEFAEESGLQTVSEPIQAGVKELEFSVAIPQAHLWSLEDPFLYEVKAKVSDGATTDTVDTYFGMRKISVVKLPGTDIPYIALNNKPIYLQLCLDQSYHEDGYYTFPSDEFMRDEILRSRRIGLNGNRIHIKVEVPRKLYWADKLGLLIMADVPNFWGEPGPKARAESEYTMRRMVKRDFNHPSIFSWIDFNETWGLKTGDDHKYLPETQEWVRDMYHLTKSLDPTRLVEENSTCNWDHVETDINSWHAYRPGYDWREFLDDVCKQTYPGSGHSYIGDNKQDGDPMMNSECGNVWGYEGSTGDVDWSWDYHLMMNEFRRHPKMCGWLYTEHHDVINEWNGYYRFDRSMKYTGVEELVDGMSLNDWHSPIYLSPGVGVCHTVTPGEKVSVPLHLSSMTDKPMGDKLTLKCELYGWDSFGERESYSTFSKELPYKAWMQSELEPLAVTMPSKPAVAVLAMVLENSAGDIVQHNFVTFDVRDGVLPRDETVIEDGVRKRIIRFAPKSYTSGDFSVRLWDVLDGLKVNAAGAGYLEYHIAWPEGLKASDITSAVFKMEASAKELFGKDVVGAKVEEGDFMRGGGTHDPVKLPNAYAMTDEVKYQSAVTVSAAGKVIGRFDLPDDPADHRGILSWHSQLQDKKLREAGSYGYLLSSVFTEESLAAAEAAGEIVLRIAVDDSLPGGIAIYGDKFGRYMLDPTIVFAIK